MTCAETRQLGRTASVSYASNVDKPKSATMPDKNGSTDSLESRDPTREETDPLVISSRNQPYLDYGASGVPALRIENLSKVSTNIPFMMVPILLCTYISTYCTVGNFCGSNFSWFGEFGQFCGSIFL